MSVELTQDERDALNAFVGVGILEVGEVHPDLRSAITKLGLEPIDWHGRRVLELEPFK